MDETANFTREPKKFKRFDEAISLNFYFDWIEDVNENRKQPDIKRALTMGKV